MRATVLVLVAGLVLLAVPSAATPAVPGAVATVEVRTHAMVYRDMFSAATFDVTGACVEEDHDVSVTERDCDPDDPRASTARGVVNMAALGFHTRRSVDLLDDAPAYQPDQALADEQLHVVRVTVGRGGSLTVRLAGIPTDEVDPEPVPGSASPGGQLTERAVQWTVDDAPAGDYRFSARFHRGAAAGFVGTFVPEATVELRAETDALLEHSSASVPAAGPVDRTSRLVMNQRVAPPYGAPEVSLSPLSSVASRDVPDAFGLTGTLRTRGSYQATASGLVTAAQDLPLSEIAPGAEGVVNAAGVASMWMSPIGTQKAVGIAGLHVETEPELTVTGLRMGMQTASPLVATIWGPLAGTMYEGESQRIGVTGILGTVKAGRQDEPAGSAGVIRPDWGGGWTRVTSDMLASQSPATEPLGVSWEMWGATIPVVVEGGDLDNRAGQGHIAGQPVVVDTPDHRAVRLLLAGYLYILETEFDILTEWTDQGAVLTPRLGPGGYWLESSGGRYDRDWSNLMGISVVLDERDEGRPTSQPNIDSVLVVPEGAAGGLVLLDFHTRTVHRLSLGSGIWRVQGSRDGLRAVPAPAQAGAAR